MQQPITADQLLRVYANGIFPMAEHRHTEELLWIEPQQRGILPLDGLHISHSLRKTLRQSLWRVSCDTAFRQIIELCAEAADNRPETWISPPIIRLFCELAERGQAHSVELWDGDELIGGLYGLALGSAFFGESMVSRRPDVSKIALVYLVAQLVRGGFTLLDTQFLTPHLARMGGIEISRRDYLHRLSQALPVPATFYGDLPADPLALLSKEALPPPLLSEQSITQIS